MVRLESFVVGEISCSHPVEHRDYEARMLASHTASRLNILGRCFGLTGHHHEPEPIDIDAHRNHVRCEKNIDRPISLSSREGLSSFLSRDGIFHDSIRLVSSSGSEMFLRGSPRC